MPKINQAGIAHLALLLILVAGIAAGTYLVSQRTNLIPYAQECEGEDCEEGDDNPGEGEPEIPPEPASEPDPAEQPPPAPEPPATDEPDPAEKPVEPPPPDPQGDDGQGGNWLDPVLEGAQGVLQGIGDAAGNLAENLGISDPVVRMDGQIDEAQQRADYIQRQLLDKLNDPEEGQKNREALAKRLGLPEDAPAGQVFTELSNLLRPKGVEVTGSSFENFEVRVLQTYSEGTAALAGGGEAGPRGRTLGAYSIAADTVMQVGTDCGRILSTSSFTIKGCGLGEPPVNIGDSAVKTPPIPPGYTLVPKPEGVVCPLSGRTSSGEGCNPGEVVTKKGDTTVDPPPVPGGFRVGDPCDDMPTNLKDACENINTGAILNNSVPIIIPDSQIPQGVESSKEPSYEQAQRGQSALERINQSFPERELFAGRSGIDYQDFFAQDISLIDIDYYMKSEYSPRSNARKDDLIFEVTDTYQLQPGTTYNYVWTDDGRIFAAERIPNEEGVKHIQIAGKVWDVDESGIPGNPGVGIIQSGEMKVEGDGRIFVDLQSGTFSNYGSRKQWSSNYGNFLNLEDLFEGKLGVRPLAVSNSKTPSDSDIAAAIERSTNTESSSTIVTGRGINPKTGQSFVNFRTRDGENWHAEKDNTGEWYFLNLVSGEKLDQQEYSKRSSVKYWNLDQDGNWNFKVGIYKEIPFLTETILKKPIADKNAAGLSKNSQVLGASTTNSPSQPIALGYAIYSESIREIEAKLEAEGKITSEQIQEIIIEKSVYEQSGTRTSAIIEVLTGSDGVVKFKAPNTFFSLKANPIKSVDISLPGNFNPARNKIIAVGIKPGSGKISYLPQSNPLNLFEAKPALAADEEKELTVAVYYDKNGNGRWDRGENVVPWAGVTVELTDENAELKKSKSDVSFFDNIPFFKIQLGTPK